MTRFHLILQRGAQTLDEIIDLARPISMGAGPDAGLFLPDLADDHARLGLMQGEPVTTGDALLEATGEVDRWAVRVGPYRGQLERMPARIRAGWGAVLDPDLRVSLGGSTIVHLSLLLAIVIITGAAREHGPPRLDIERVPDRFTQVIFKARPTSPSSDSATSMRSTTPEPADGPAEPTSPIISAKGEPSKPRPPRLSKAERIARKQKAALARLGKGVGIGRKAGNGVDENGRAVVVSGDLTPAKIPHAFKTTTITGAKGDQRALIYRVLRRSRPSVRRCIRKHALDDDIATVFVMHLHNGRLRSGRVTGRALPGPLKSCLEAAMKTWKGWPRSKAVLVVRQPRTLKPYADQ